MAYMTVCEYCGEEKHNKGFKAHERACKRKHTGLKFADRSRTPAFQSRTRTFTVEVPDQPAPPTDVELSAGEEMETAYQMFPKNSALFLAQFNLLLAKTSADPVGSLQKAKAAIDLEIKSITGE